MRITGFDHLQIAIPRGGEDEARAFYGAVLGLEEVPKPAVLAVRGGLWFQCGRQQLHLGVEDDFRPAKKAHPGMLVEDIEALMSSLRDAGYEPMIAETLGDTRRIFIHDPFGNRIEFLERR